MGSVVKERINESTPIVERYIKDRPTRKKQNVVSEELKFISDEIDKFQSLKDTISNARNFANSCKSKLDSMKLKLDSNDELYSRISTAVASNAQGMIVSTVNEAMEKRNTYVKFLNNRNHAMKFPDMSFTSLYGSQVVKGTSNLIPPEYSLDQLRNVISEAWSATVDLGAFDMSSNQRQHYDKNKQALLQLFKQIDDSIVFFGDMPIKKGILWFVGILLFIAIITLTS
jgi:hypothetical protein